jgi:hypothetical protein
MFQKAIAEILHPALLRESAHQYDHPGLVRRDRELKTRVTCGKSVNYY